MNVALYMFIAIIISFKYSQSLDTGKDRFQPDWPNSLSCHFFPFEFFQNIFVQQLFFINSYKLLHRYRPNIFSSHFGPIGQFGPIDPIQFFFILNFLKKNVCNNFIYKYPRKIFYRIFCEVFREVMRQINREIICGLIAIILKFSGKKIEKFLDFSSN